MANLSCWNCGQSVADIPQPISRHANCSHCFEVLHCCRMCQHYVAEDHRSCDEDRADPPVIKESANFCDFYKPANRFESASAQRGEAARANLASLFDDVTDFDALSEAGAEPEKKDDARSRLDDLFD